TLALTPRSTLFPYTTLFRSRSCAQNPVTKPGQRPDLRHKAEPLDLRVHPADADSTGVLLVRDHLLAGDLVVALMLRISGKNLPRDRKSTRLNSSHVKSSYAV